MGGTSSQETGSVDISDDRLQEKSVFGSLWFWMVGGLLAVALPIGLMAWSSAIWSNRDASLLGEKQEDFEVFVPPEPVKVSPKKRSLWS
ncbi:MAG: hypothetical protein ACKN82_03100, partial [Pirellula sp.]